ncbi:MAG: hypothetical protein QM487_00465 [Candidatus Marithrix sp.]
MWFWNVLERGAKIVLSLRALVQTTNRWQLFWDKINLFGGLTILNIISRPHP